MPTPKLTSTQTVLQGIHHSSGVLCPNRIFVVGSGMPPSQGYCWTTGPIRMLEPLENNCGAFPTSLCMSITM